MIFQSAVPSLPPLSSVETRVMAAMAHNHRSGINGHPAGAGFDGLDGLSADLCDHALARLETKGLVLFASIVSGSPRLWWLTSLGSQFFRQGVAA